MLKILPIIPSRIPSHYSIFIPVSNLLYIPIVMLILVSVAK